MPGFREYEELQGQLFKHIATLVCINKPAKELLAFYETIKHDPSMKTYATCIEKIKTGEITGDYWGCNTADFDQVMYYLDPEKEFSFLSANPPTKTIV